MKKLLLSILSIVTALGVNLQGAQPKKDSFNYADHELKGELADDIRGKIQKPWNIDQLPGFNTLNSDNWSVGEYGGKIIKARKTEKVRFINASEVAGRTRDVGNTFFADMIDNAYTQNPEKANAQFGVTYGSNQNLSRVRNAQAIQTVIDKKDAGGYAGVPKKQIIKLTGDNEFSDENSIVVADRVEGDAVFTGFTVQELGLLNDVIEETDFMDVHPGNFIRTQDGKLMFIDTESTTEGMKEKYSKGFLGSYMSWKIGHAQRRTTKSVVSQYLAQHSNPANMQNMDEQEKELLRKTMTKVNQSYYKHFALSIIEIPIVASIMTGLVVRNKVYTRSDNKLLNKCIQAMHEKTEAICKDLELLSQEERTDKIRDIVIDVLKENCPKDQDSAVIDAFVSLVYADVFVINDQEKKATIKESTRVIKKAWGDEWSLWAKAKRLATKVVSLGRTNKATKIDDGSEATKKTVPIAA